MDQRAGATPVEHPARRLAALDGLRGLAIPIVMVFHFTTYRGMQPVVLIDKLYYRIVTTGWFGVDLFFVLSGFLITGILLDTRGRQRYFRNFYARRALRIFPLYYGFLVGFYVVFPRLVTPGAHFPELAANQGWWWAYLTNIQMAFDWPLYPGSQHLWSLAVEEQFYLAWPLVIWLLSRRRLAGLCLACIAASLLVRLGLHLAGYANAAYVLTPARMDGLAAGALLALLARQPGGLLPFARYARVVVLASAGVLLALFIRQHGLDRLAFLVQTVGYTLLVALFGGLLVLAVVAPQGGGVARLLALPPLRFFGHYSYALYVFHLPVANVLEQFLPPIPAFPTIVGSQLPGQAVFILAATGVSVALARVSWSLWEQPFLRLKVHFPAVEPRETSQPEPTAATSLVG